MNNIHNIMDSSLGVQGVLEPSVQDLHLPQARPLTTDVATESSLADLYRAPSLQSHILSGLQPRIDDEALLRPDVLGRNLKESLACLEESRDAHIRRFVRDDLKPLLENEQLLNDYVNMLVSG
jgi:hypothetical protein